MFLQAILQFKIVELLLNKMKRDFKRDKLEKEKEKFQTYLKGIVNKRKSRTNFNFSDMPPNIDNDQDEQKKSKFEFFTEGTNQKIDSFVQKFGLSSENLEFLECLQWDYCKKILENNDLKIHFEIDNIYYKNSDTNESIFEFMKNQQDSSKEKINFNLMYDGNYNDYFRWILNGFDACEKN